MRILLDTNVLVWWLTEDKRLTPANYELISEPSNVVFVSVCSIWEIAIKASIGKLHLAGSIEQLVQPALRQNDIEFLPIRIEQVIPVETMPFHHSDPFDRLLVAQAQVEGLTLLTSDMRLRAYDVPIISA